MKFSINTYVKDVDTHGRGIAVMDVHFEVADPDTLDALTHLIMNFFHTEEEKEQKEAVLGFHAEPEEGEEKEEWEGDEECKEEK